MQELNLIPDKYKRQKYNSLRKKDMAAIAIIAASVIFAALYIPYKSLKNMEDKQIQLKKKCMVYENVKNQNTKYKNQIKTIQKYISAYESISKSKVMVSTAISGIQNYTSSDITFDKLTYENKLITVNAHTANYSSIYIFAANLEQSKEYNGVRVGTVKFDEDKKWYEFTVTMNS